MKCEAQAWHRWRNAPQKAELSEGSRARSEATERTSEAKCPQGAACKRQRLRRHFANSGQGARRSGCERERARTAGCARRRRDGGGRRREVFRPSLTPRIGGWIAQTKADESRGSRAERSREPQTARANRAPHRPRSGTHDAKRPGTRNGRARTQSSDCGAARDVSVTGLFARKYRWDDAVRTLTGSTRQGTPYAVEARQRHSSKATRKET